jgi:rhodanese-related sulfurtransferase
VNEFVAIGEYQLANLLRNRVKFTFIDLSSESERLTRPAGWFEGSIRAPDAEAAVHMVRDAGVPSDGAVVLICGNGVKSVAAAGLLAKQSFINVFVVEGGIESLSEQGPR